MKKLTYIFALSALIPAFASAATLSLSPSFKSVDPGETFTVDILLDTEGEAIDGADITYLKYDQAILQVEKVTPGSLMAMTLSNTASNGQIQFSQVINGGGVRYNGKGTLATITFKALSGGKAEVKFDFIKGDTRDTNVAGNQTDLLAAVTNGSYSVSGAGFALDRTTIYVLLGLAILGVAIILYRSKFKQS